jgi:hypothetical protein
VPEQGLEVCRVDINDIRRCAVFALISLCGLQDVIQHGASSRAMVDSRQHSAAGVWQGYDAQVTFLLPSSIGYQLFQALASKFRLF